MALPTAILALRVSCPRPVVILISAVLLISEFLLAPDLTIKGKGFQQPCCPTRSNAYRDRTVCALYTGDSSNYVVGHTPPVRVFAARPGSLKREALEAESQVARPMKRRCIPKVIQEGFKAQEKILDEGN
jgi:hypothetical protein